MTLNQRQEKLVKTKVESGLYGSTDEVIDKALELLDEYDRRISDLREGIHAAIEQANNGQLTAASEVLDHLERRNARRAT